MKAAIVVFLALAVSACGKVDQLTAQYTGQPARVCVAGITYLQFTTGAAVLVNKDGKPVECK